MVNGYKQQDLFSSLSKNGVNLGFEEKLWQAADKLRGNIDAASYKHIVLGLIFLKYIFDSFSERYQSLQNSHLDPEKKDLYASEGAFWIPPFARWSYIEENSKSQYLGKILDDALSAIEQENPSLKGILGQTYSQSHLDKRRLSELVELMGTIQVGDESSRSQDVLGRVYEYFLGEFAGTEGKGGEYYTPRSIVQLLVEMVEPYEGTVYDPCCGSGGMFVQSRQFVEAHGGNPEKVSVYGQELNTATWRLCKMNLTIRGITCDLGDHAEDTLHNDLHPALKANYILSNPPFNISDWGQTVLLHDKRWKYGIPPKNNANWAWVQHIISHLAPDGIAGFVLANGTLSAANAQETHIRQALIEADLVDCIVALPSNLFYTTQIAASIWIIAQNKTTSTFRHRNGETLFINAVTFGSMSDRTHKALLPEEIAFIANIYHTWRSKNTTYQDIPGFCKSAHSREMSLHRWTFVPGRYVGFDRSQRPKLDINQIRDEIELIEERLVEAHAASETLLTTLRGIVNG